MTLICFVSFIIDWFIVISLLPVKASGKKLSIVSSFDPPPLIIISLSLVDLNCFSVLSVYLILLLAVTLFLIEK